MEILKLRIKDVDFDFKTINIHDPKGGDGRVSILPDSIVDDLHLQIEIVKELHGVDLKNSYGGSFYPMD